MSRAVVWLQLLIGWLPVWALFTMLIATAHSDATPLAAAMIAARMIVAGAALGLLVHRLTDRLPWPHPFRPSFAAVHLGAAMAYAASWLALNSVIESIIRGQAVIVVGPGLVPYLVLGIWLYVMIAGVTYATRATQRAARAEVEAARSQLAALRAQLNPHFLFNALHTVVQLMPHEPARAARAAEQLAGLLRTTIEEDRDLVSLAEECAFVQRYLDVESLRFGDRLVVRMEVPDALHEMQVPCFALQTLVENAVRHGAAPRVEPTTITVAASASGEALVLTVHDTGAGASGEVSEQGAGTGLRRLRERLSALHGAAARLELTNGKGQGFAATLVLPQRPPDE